MWNKMKDISPKNRRRLVYSVVMVFVPLCVLIGLTLGWFAMIQTSVDLLDFKHNSDVYNVYLGEDKDGDGIPDTDDDGEVIYVPVIEDGIIIEYMYPQFTTAFRMELHVGGGDSTVLGYLNNICPPAEQYLHDAPDPLPDPAVDLADVLYLRYERPLADGTFESVDAKLSDLFIDGTRNIVLMDSVIVPAQEQYILDYEIYMHPDAGNEYQSMRLIVEEAIFRTQR